ncbi:MAG: phosphoenolpyruvate mutase [Clostridia bacterium]|nr:phosphoenolpyruvate mutase [Clostridia bacterium]
MKKVYICFSTDILHNGHLIILKRAAELGEVTVGLLTDEVIASYKHYPLIPLEERIAMFESLKGVSRVVVQESLDYTAILSQLKPDIVVHGDDWHVGYQANIRQQVIETLKGWGGELVEFPYTHTPTEETLSSLEQRMSLPESRRARLRRLMAYKPCLSVLEAHNGITGLIVEKTVVETANGRKQFDAMWVSSLCDSTAKGKPDIELVDMTSRLNTLEEIMEVTTKPIILDGDTGGQVEHFVYNVQTLERMGISAIIIEDKKGLKKNSLFGTGAGQNQDSIEDFCQKIAAGKNAQRSNDFMIIARCESLILEQGMEDALTRCHAYVAAGADGIMIHSRQKTVDEVFEFCDKFRSVDAKTPIIVVPTTYNDVPEEELAAHGVNVVIHANHLIRSAFPAMQATARSILEQGCSREASEKYCMSIKDVLELLPNR